MVEPSAFRALAGLFVERVPAAGDAPPRLAAVPREGTEPAGLDLLMVTVDEPAAGILDLRVALKHSGLNVELCRLSAAAHVESPTVVLLIVDKECDGPYRELTKNELADRFARSAVRVLDLSGDDPEENVISAQLPPRRFNFGRATRRPTRAVVAAAESIAAELFHSPSVAR